MWRGFVGRRVWLRGVCVGWMTDGSRRPQRDGTNGEKNSAAQAAVVMLNRGTRDVVLRSCGSDSRWLGGDRQDRDVECVGGDGFGIGEAGKRRSERSGYSVENCWLRCTQLKRTARDPLTQPAPQPGKLRRKSAMRCATVAQKGARKYEIDRELFRFPG